MSRLLALAGIGIALAAACSNLEKQIVKNAEPQDAIAAIHQEMTGQRDNEPLVIGAEWCGACKYLTGVYYPRNGINFKYIELKGKYGMEDILEWCNKQNVEYPSQPGFPLIVNRRTAQKRLEVSCGIDTRGYSRFKDGWKPLE